MTNATSVQNQKNTPMPWKAHWRIALIKLRAKLKEFQLYIPLWGFICFSFWASTLQSSVIAQLFLLAVVLMFVGFPASNGTNPRILRPFGMVTEDIRRQVILNYVIYSPFVLATLAIEVYLQREFWVNVAFVMTVVGLVAMLLWDLQKAKEVEFQKPDRAAKKQEAKRRSETGDVDAKAGWFARFESRAHTAFDQVVTVRVWKALLTQWGLILMAAIAAGLWITVKSAVLKQPVAYDETLFLLILVCGLIMVVPAVLGDCFVKWLALSGDRQYFATRVWKPVALTTVLGPMCVLVIVLIRWIVAAVVPEFDSYNSPLNWGALGAAMGYALALGAVIAALQLFLTIAQIKWAGWWSWAIIMVAFGSVVGVTVAAALSAFESSIQGNYWSTLGWAGVEPVVFASLVLWLWFWAVPRLDASKATDQDVLGVKKPE